MKTKYIFFAKYFVYSLALTSVMSSCNDFLDVTPPTGVTDESYLKTDAQLGSYVMQYYANYSAYSNDDDNTGGMLPSPLGTGGNSPLKNDINTDNEVGRSTFSNAFIAGKGDAKQVAQTGGKWNFTNIYKWNYFINIVQPRIDNGEISGNQELAKHYLGEAYFLRAYEYFFRLRKLGDFPIVTETLPDDRATLTEASKRRPRNEVARFILQDLDRAINLLLETSPDGGKNRICKDAAYLLKARVALFEGTWLKYHAGTPLVPNGPGWPGKEKDYNANYQFPSGSIEAESKYFLEEAMKAAKVVADNHQLAENNKQVILDAAGTGYESNPYYSMFASEDPSKIDEVLMCRSYKKTVSAHWFNQLLQRGGGGFGYTKGLEKSFLTENGLPWYAAGNTEYAGDNSVADTKKNRDYRWQLFMKATGERCFTNATMIFGDPNEAGKLVPNIYDNDGKKGSSTGYIHGKGYTLDVNNSVTNFGEDVTAYVIFRAAEAYLIYLEASCEVNNGQSIDATAATYWKALRARAGVDTDYNKTIAATDMNKEAENDWGAYSHGQLVTPMLYNIRRERRCEFIGEGYRMDDLLRWRALDQLKGTHVYGCKVANKSDYDYTAPDGTKQNYLDEKLMKLDSNGYIDVLTAASYADGLTFTEAHYLEPISVQHFLITAPDGKTVTDSPIYQNPGWQIQAGTTAEVK